MLLRGQALVGYRPYADDVVDAFVHRSTEAGIDIFRVFDALNDPMNLERAAAAVKDSGAHLQLTICYSVTEEGVLGGPIYNLDYYIAKAKELLDLGADSICVKDMAGLLAPYDSFNLFTALKEVVDVPLQLAHPLHERHGLDDRPQGDRSWRGHRRRLSRPSRPPHRAARHRAAHHRT